MTERFTGGVLNLGNLTVPIISAECEESLDNYKFYGNVQKLPTSCIFELKDVKLFGYHERSPTK
jgi:hypothetical protein